MRSSPATEPMRCGVGLPVEGVLVGETVEALGYAHQDADGGEQPDRTAGADHQQQRTGGDLDETADDELGADGRDAVR